MGSKGFHDCFHNRLLMLIQEYPQPNRFASAVKVDEKTVLAWYYGKALPRVDTVAEICRRSNVRVSWLFGETDDPGRELHLVPQVNWQRKKRSEKNRAVDS